MSGILTRWLVQQQHTVNEPDLGADGYVSDAAIERWVTAAIKAYLDRCDELRHSARRAGLHLARRQHPLPRGSLLGRATEVIVTASASEIRPESFTVSVRLRPTGGDRDAPLNVRCVIRLEDPATGAARELGTAVRDELIALEHSAAWFN